MAFRELGRPALRSLAEALESGRLEPPYSRSRLEEHAPKAALAGVAATLEEMAGQGMTPVHLALVLRLLDEERAVSQAAADRLELVWSGTEVEGATSRDTAVVVQELFRTARRSLLIASYALDRGAKANAIFGPLAERMDAEPGLDVRLFLNIHRPFGDEQPEEVHVRAFARSFREELWPGSRLPAVFYDPRSLQIGGPTRACLHAKCVIADGERALITSANFTEAAHERNLEAGLLVEGAGLCKALRNQFDTLASQRAVNSLRF